MVNEPVGIRDPETWGITPFAVRMAAPGFWQRFHAHQQAKPVGVPSASKDCVAMVDPGHSIVVLKKSV